MSYNNIINERYNYDKTVYGDIKVNDIEYSMNEAILMKGIQIGAKMERVLHG